MCRVSQFKLEKVMESWRERHRQQTVYNKAKIYNIKYYRLDKGCMVFFSCVSEKFAVKPKGV